jgi:hypothetical protein
MSRSKAALLGLAAAALGGCATTDPLDGAGIVYRMPRGDAVATLAADLRGCDPLEIEADLALTPKAGVDSRPDRLWEVPGKALTSSFTKRALSLKLTKDGVISEVNSEASDRRAQVLGNVAKIAAAVVPLLVAPPKAPLPTCSTEARAGVQRRALLKAQIEAVRVQLATGTGAPQPADPKLVRTLNRLAKELVALEGGVLHAEAVKAVPLNDTLVLDGATPFQVAFDAEPFAKWFGGAADPAIIFPLTWTAARVAATPQTLKLPSAFWPRHCNLSLKTPNPMSVKVVATDAKGEAVDVTVPAAQLGQPKDLCIDAGFGESRAIGLAFDDYGRVNSFSWNSEASAETLSGAFADAAPSLVAVAGALRGPDAVTAQKTEIERLETQQKLNTLRACQLVIEAGGFDCGD